MLSNIPKTMHAQSGSNRMGSQQHPGTPRALVFKTPMTYSPHMMGDQARPSPSRQETWMNELGLTDTNIDSDLASSEDELEEIDHSANNVSVVEFHTLKRQLAERDSQRAELLLTIRANEDKLKTYKSKLHKEETTKKQQIKILKKTHETLREDNEQVVRNLEAIIDEQEARIVQLESGDTGYLQQQPHKYLGISGLVDQVNRNQQDRAELTNQYLAVQSQLEKVKNDHKNELDTCQRLNARLQEEISKDGSIKKDNDKRRSESENLLKDLQGKYEKAKNELSEARRLQPIHNQATKKDDEKVKKLEKENARLKDKLLNLEADLAISSKQVLDEQAKHQNEIRQLQREKQESVMQLREMRKDLTSLHAKQPEVITKVERVEVESQAATNALTLAEEQKDKLQKELDSCQRKIEQMNRMLAEEQAKNKQLQEQVTDKTAKEETQSKLSSKALVQSQDQNKQLQSEVDIYMAKADEFHGLLQAEQAKNRELNGQITQFTSEMEIVKAELVQELKDSEQSKNLALQQAKQEADRRLSSYKEKHMNMKMNVIMATGLIAKLSKDYKRLKKEAAEFPQMMEHVVKNTSKQISQAIASIDENNKDLVRKYQKELKLRKKFHNELVELKGNIRVFCRVRPTTCEDDGMPLSNCIASFDRDDDGLLFINNKGKEQTFEMDKVFNMKSKQEQVFAEVCPIVISCVDGYNVCIFAYGQTGSGKTYTMEGPPNEPGINQRALIQLFHETHDRVNDWIYHIDVSVMEIYNEMPRDLLSSDPTNKLDIKMNSTGEVFVPGLTRIEVKTVEDVNRVFEMGHTNRATSATNMNEHSSRSHCLLCVTVTGTNKTTGAKTIGKLNLVDLAGSERVGKSGAEGARLKEAQNINKSLSSLGDVIAALKSKQQYVPYRNSKLTYLLQDCLGGDSKTLMIVQVAPVERHVSESVCSLTFAQRVRAVELGAATKKMESGEVANLREKLSQYESAGSPRSLTPSRGGIPRSLTPSRQTPGGKRK